MVDQVKLYRQALALEAHRNFARAAESLNLTQPSLTRGVAALERSLGVLLFERNRRGVVPTAFGRMFLARAAVLLAGHADLRRELQLLAGLDSGTLVIGAGPYAAETSVAETVARFAKEHPKLRIECLIAEPERVVQDVLAGHTDVGVSRIAGFERESSLIVEALPPLPIFLACRPGHPLTREARPSLARVLSFPLVTTRLRGAQAMLAASRDPATASEVSGDAEFAPQILVNSLAIARMIARGSDAIVPATAQQLADDIEAGRLVKLDVRARAMQTPHGLFYLRDRPLVPAARRFIEILRIVEAEAQVGAAKCAATLKAVATPARRSKGGR